MNFLRSFFLTGLISFPLLGYAALIIPEDRDLWKKLTPQHSKVLKNIIEGTAHRHQMYERYEHLMLASSSDLQEASMILGEAPILESITFADSPEDAHRPQLAHTLDDNADDVIIVSAAAAGVCAIALGAGAGVRYSIKRKRQAGAREVDMEAEKYILEWSSKNVFEQNMPGKNDTPRRVVPRPEASEFEPIIVSPGVDGLAPYTPHPVKAEDIPAEASHFRVDTNAAALWGHE